MPTFRAALAAALVALAGLAVPATATDGPALAVDVSASRHAINPDVYGMNWADPALLAELDVTTDRWGGNSVSRYNWTNDTSNLGSDWYFENYVYQPGERLDETITAHANAGASTVVTVPMTGWVSKASVNDPPTCGFAISKYGAQQAHDTWHADCGTGVRADGTNVTGNDPHDTSVEAGAAFAQSMVAHLVATHGDAAHGGVRTYDLDNEPALWSSTHRDVHPLPLTYDELRDKSVATATAVKTADPTAEVAGPVDWGWCAYFFSAKDGCAAGADAQAHGGKPLAEWYLAEMKKASDLAGKRLLDVFDEHFYTQADGVTLTDEPGDSATQARRLRSTRSLWDPDYVDESWIGRPYDVGAPPIRMIPWMRDVVAANYPGTKIAIGEYNWGGVGSVNGALAEADVLGIFGRERLDAAMMWDPPSRTQPVAYAFRMYRNYDGAGHKFGDTSVRATSADQSKLAVYAAQRGSDGAVTVMVVNKTASALTSPLALSGATFGGGAQRWAYSGVDATHIRRLADVPVSGGAVTTTYEPNSITLLVLPAGPAAAAKATALTIARSATAVTYGTSVTVSGRLTAGGAAVAGRRVTLQARRKGTSTWTSVATATSGSDGRFAKAFTPRWTAALRWRFAGDTAYISSVSPGTAVTVRAKVTSTLSPTSVPRGGTAYIKGGVYPAHPGTAYQVEEWTSADGWTVLGTKYLSSSSTYVSTKRPGTRGTKYYRVHWLGDTDHAAAYGPTVKLTVT